MHKGDEYAHVLNMQLTLCLYLHHNITLGPKNNFSWQ